jgi:NodT family efflux transporter outer membrane factor (OMF) lipoprotein
MPKLVWIGAACVMLLTLSGCRIIPTLCCADPGPPLPDSYNGLTSAENSAQVGIVEFFNDPVLSQLIIQGLQQNQELKIRNQEVMIAYNEIMAARGAYLPFVSAVFRGGMERNSRFTPLGAAESQLTTPVGGEFPDPLGNLRLSADVWWQIDIWRQLRNARDAAIQRYWEAVESRNYLITQLVADTAENYYELSSLDQRLIYLDQTIKLQLESLEVAKEQVAAARGTKLGVQRFLAEVRKNESQRLIIGQRIVEVENRINFLVGRYPQPVQRPSWNFITLDSRPLNVGIPPQLLLNRRDIQAAERELIAAGLDVRVARANFLPKLILTAGVGYEAFEPKYLFDPGAFIANAAGELVAPLVNRAAIRAQYLNANARQIQAAYEYQRTVLNAFTEVVNNMAKVRNYRQSVAIKQEQVIALDESVKVARELFNSPIKEEFAKVEYIDILLATRDLLEARTVLIETKQQQLTAIVDAYQALGGGLLVNNGGPLFPELFCMPELPVDGLAAPPPPAEAVEPPAPDEANPPPPPAIMEPEPKPATR